jgi:hypothetical protein
MLQVVIKKILNEVGRTTAVSLAEAHQKSGVASGPRFGTPPRGLAGQRQSWGSGLV